MSLRCMTLGFLAVVNEQQGSGPFSWPGLGAELAMADGRPPTCKGELYIGVAGGTWQADYIEGLHEIVGIRLFVSRKGGCTSVDKWAKEYIYAGYGGPDPKNWGLLYMAERIRAWTHLDANQDAVLNEANSLLDKDYGEDGRTVYGFTVPLEFLGASNPVIKPASWWTGQEGNPEPYGGLFMTIDFGKAERFQPIEGMT